MKGSESNFDAQLIASITSGRVLALEYVVQLLIATHPERGKLRALWHGLLPEQLDQWSDEPGYAANDYMRKALHASLSQLGGYLDVEVPDAGSAPP
ncbi:MAG: hypothetical protein ACREPQ_09755 [Rhodanobacter sp.]